MDRPKLIYFKEPLLTFAYGQKMEDPRDGLTLFGPYSKDKTIGQVNIGIIGPEEQRKRLKEYLKKIHKPVLSSEKDVARPYFPGIEATFGIFINFKAIEEIDVPIKEIDKYLNYTDGFQRVYNLTNLFAEKLFKYCNQENTPINVWLVVIPERIYQLCRPKSRIQKSNENVKIGLNKKERNSKQDFLFDYMNDLKEAYNFEVNFHNQLKAKLLSYKVVSQIIRETTISYETIFTDENQIKYERIFDSAKAWNISTTLYYKSGGLPWKLGDIRKNVCYLGLVYKKIETNDKNRNACCAAQMFLDSGDGMVFRGNIGPWYNPVTKEYHISSKDAEELLSNSLEAFREKSENKTYPDEIFIHAKTYFDDEEWKGFSQAANNKSIIFGIRIKDDNSFKLYREFTYCIPRGSALLVNDKFAFLWTKGFIPRIQTQLGLETPNPLSVEVIRGNKEIETVCKDILSLSKLNYNACIFADGSPVTLKFADSIGEILTAGKDIKSEVLPFKHYL